MGDWLKDWEEQNYRQEMESQTKQQTKLLKERNLAQQKQIAAEEARYQREYLDRQHKEYRDKIDSLKLTLAQTTDPLVREQVGSLLKDAKQDYQNFLDHLERQRLEAEEAERERKRRSRHFMLIIFAIIVIIILRHILF